jgi:ABC-type amino acid transport substrate-binding protein
MRLSPRTGLAALALASLVVPLPAHAGPTLDRIKIAGTVQMGYRDDAAPFSYKDRDGRVRGYSVELCEKAAAEIGKAAGIHAIKVEWRPLTAATRFDAVVNREVDLECGTSTISLSRMASVDFSLPIYVDGGAVLVRNKSNLARLDALKGKRIAVIPGTTTEQALARTLSSLGAPATVVPIQGYVEGLGLLINGRVDGLAGDRIVLTTLRQRSAGARDTDFLPGDLSYEPYALVMRRDDPDFRLAVNRALVELYRGGGIDPIFQRHFASLGVPGPMLHAMFYLNTVPQ